MPRQKVESHHLPARYAGGWCRVMQFLLRYCIPKVPQQLPFLIPGWFDPTLRLQIERGTPLNDVQKAATFTQGADAGTVAAKSVRAV